MQARAEPVNFSDLFPAPSMFDSPRSWAAQGFTVLDRHDESRVMVAAHSLAPGLLFKKYSNAVKVDQCRNYDARVEGADRLRAFVREHGLEHVVVPRKHLVDLPRSHGPCEHVLVVDKIDVLRVKETERGYRAISEAVLRELCLVLFRFRGLDSIVDNVALTTAGKIAFIDTEHWSGGRRRPYLRYIRRFLSREHRQLAKKLFRKFEHDRPDVDRNAFVSEEDTSSWSSLSS